MAWSLSASSSQTTNVGANTSTVYVNVIAYWTFGSSFINTGPARLDVNIGGNIQTAYFSTINGSQTSTGSQDLGTYSWTFTHDANGYRGAVGTSGRLYNIPFGSPNDMTADGGTQPALDYDRRPATPSSVTSVLNANKSITVTSNAVSSPAGTPTYYVAYSSNAGSYWSGYTTIPSNSNAYTYAFGSLPLGKSYRFRMYASNSDGNGGVFTQSTDLFLPAGGKRWTGSAWQATTLGRRWNGSAWVDLATAKRWNGSAWVDLS